MTGARQLEMTRSVGIRGVWVGIVFALATCSLISCQPPASNGANSAPSAMTARVETHPTDPVRDLSQDEAAGGHILRKHVGQTDDQLRERLEREPRITESSAGSTAPADIPTWCWIMTARLQLAAPLIAERANPTRAPTLWLY